MKNFVCVTLCLALLASCQEKPKEKMVQKVSKPVLPAFVQSPIPQADVPYQTYTFEAEKGAELAYPTGTKIKIPANALTDEAGKPITGQVSLAYREFHDAVDVLVSGIPMQYDSAGVRQSLQTAGMFEIKAEQAGKALRLAKGKQARIRMASWQSDADYNFYNLDTTKRNWAYQTREKAEVNTEKQTAKVAFEQLRAKIPNKRFVLSIGNAFDISVNDETDKIENKALERVFVQRFQGYNVAYVGGAYGYDAVQIMGLGEYAAHDLVWELVGSQTLPALPISEKVPLYNTKIKPLGNGTFLINFYKDWNYNPKEQPFAVSIGKPVMRIASLLAHSPEKWKAEEAQLMETIRKEEERIKQMAEVFRPIAINNFGIHNFDRYMKDDLKDQAVFVDASFKLFGSPAVLPAQDVKKVFYINPKLRSSTEYERGLWNIFAMTPEPKARVMAILSNYRIAIVKPEDYRKIDFQTLKPDASRKDRPAYTFTLHEQTDLVKSREDLRKALEMN